MENIYKVKVRTNPEPNWVYPSERRYSASTVLGLGVVHLALASTALLLSCLTFVNQQQIKNETGSITSNASNDINPEVLQMYNEMNKRFDVNKNISENNQTDDVTVKEEGLEGISNVSRKNTQNTPFSMMNLNLAPGMMFLGALVAGLTGLLAWKKWYIDQNIKWFFIMSVFSSITSFICMSAEIVVIAMATEVISFEDSLITKETHQPPSLKLVVSLNIAIASILEFIWSVMSSKIAYKGMMNDYPDDIVLSKPGGKKEVCTVRKGNSRGRLMPPDILNHFPLGGKFSKYFPRKDNGYLPKEESHSEYQERVNRFLASQNSCASSVR